MEEKKYNKLGEWMRSDAKPLMDLSVLDEKHRAAMMRLILK